MDLLPKGYYYAESSNEQIQDLTDATDYAKKNPDKSCDGMAKIYGQLELGIDLKFIKISFPTIVKLKMGLHYQNILRSLSEQENRTSTTQFKL